MKFIKKHIVTHTELLKMNIVNLSDAGYNDIRILEAIELYNNVSKVYPCELKFTVNEYEDNNKIDFYLENKEVSFTGNNLLFTIHFESYRKKYHISCKSLNQLNHIELYNIESIKKNIETPNNIGVLTTKKIEQWVDYFTQIYNEAILINEENKKEIDDFIKSLESVENIQWYNSNGFKDGERNAGTILKNGIEFTFKIEKTHVSQQIKLHYSVNNTLNDFLTLSDNKYITPTIK